MIGFYGLLGLVLGVVSTSVIFGFSDQREEFARQEIQIIASHIEQFQTRQKQKKNARMPSSTTSNASILRNDEGLEPIGTLGEDPWGEQYKYAYFHREESLKTVLLVWSAGENQKSEIQISEFSKLSQNEAVFKSRASDDIVFIKELSTKDYF